MGRASVTKVECVKQGPSGNRSAIALKIFPIWPGGLKVFRILKAALTACFVVGLFIGVSSVSAEAASEEIVSETLALGAKAHSCNCHAHSRKHRAKKRKYHKAKKRVYRKARKHKRHYRKTRKHRRHPRRAKRWSGQRYRAQRPGYNHYHAGYWYPVVWWVPVVVQVYEPVVTYRTRTTTTHGGAHGSYNGGFNLYNPYSHSVHGD